jgi:signal transduction histidine kinase
MQRLVADVLDITRFRTGSIRLQLRRFDARTLARDAAAIISPVLRPRGQTLQLTLPERPVWVYGDRRRLEQALLNLLSNAQRFSPEQGTLGLAVAQADEEAAWSVSDQGPGIPPADRAKLFERFFVGPSDSSGHASGAGLGLPIALAIAQAHGGTIELQSVVGQGSSFTLRVPLRGPDDDGDR